MGLSKLKVLKKKIDMSGGVLRACFTLKACKSLQTSFTLVGTCQTTNVPFMCRTKCVFKKRCMLAQFHFHSSKVKPQTKKSMDFFSTDDKHLTQAKYNLCEELSQVQSNGQNAYLQYLLFNAWYTAREDGAIQNWPPRVIIVFLIFLKGISYFLPARSFIIQHGTNTKQHPI